MIAEDFKRAKNWSEYFLKKYDCQPIGFVGPLNDSKGDVFFIVKLKSPMIDNLKDFGSIKETLKADDECNDEYRFKLYADEIESIDNILNMR